jgi:hypothetical protein
LRIRRRRRPTISSSLSASNSAIAHAGSDGVVSVLAGASSVAAVIGSGYRPAAAATVGRLSSVWSIERTSGGEIRNVHGSGACGQTPRKCRSARRPCAPQPGAASLLSPESTMMRACRWNCGS